MKRSVRVSWTAQKMPLRVVCLPKLASLPKGVKEGGEDASRRTNATPDANFDRRTWTGVFDKLGSLRLNDAPKNCRTVYSLGRKR